MTTPTTVVAISRQFGSGGAWIGRAVAQRLDFQYADREILAEAAKRLQLQAEDLEALDEHAASIWSRIGNLFALGSPDTPFIPPTLPVVSESDLFRVEQQVIERIAAHGNAVIVGRGAAHVLGGELRVVRVFLHAPFEARVTLAMQEYGFTDRQAAAVVVGDSDRARAQFVRSITKRDWCDATLYDVSLNTAVLGLERSVEVIVELVQRPPAAPLPPLTPRTAENRVSS